ncbi:hypothetical protein GCM10025331_54600 [Actinoplanes utahensis]|nr:hypothetical protein Aut01nite_62380 [Actinoplanes utahensis]
MQETMRQLTDLAAQCATWRVSPLPQADLLDFLDGVHQAQQMLQAALLHAVDEVRARGIPAAEHAPSPRLWFRDRLRISPRAATRLLNQATTVDRHDDVNAALAAGKVNVEQLTAITNALAELPKDIGPTIRTDAAAALAGWAPHLDPGGLRAMGRRILDHVAPEVAEAIEERRLRDSERDAHQQRYLTLTAVGDGRVRVSGILDSEAAAIVAAALDPLCKPDTVAAEMAATGEARTPGQRRADALVEVCRLVLTGGPLPDNGGDRPQIAVTVAFDPLRAALGAGVLDSGEPVSAETVRRLGCDARILPVVLNGAGQILDAGRTRRTATGSLRRALTVRDRGCAFPGCDRPPRWCDAHHVISWADDGPTDLGNLVLLCGHHHRLIHAGAGWEIHIAADGLPEFLPPSWLDANRLPRRNQYHRRT